MHTVALLDLNIHPVSKVLFEVLCPVVEVPMGKP